MNPNEVAAVLDPELEALCRRLRFRYIREQGAEVLATAKAQRWDPAETLRVLLVAEAEGRDAADEGVPASESETPGREDL